MRSKWLNCSCGSAGHHIRVSIDDNYGEDYGNVCLEYHLCDVGFWHRLLNGIKYIFGRQADYHDIILDSNEQQKLIDILLNNR